MSADIEEGIFADESDEIPIDYEIDDDDDDDDTTIADDATFTYSDIEENDSAPSELKIAHGDQINMIYLRRYIDQLAEKVEERNYHVQKTREELKKCRDHIEELKKEHKVVIASIEQNEKENNTAALYRLKATEQRIQHELDNELKLQQKIADVVDKAEYELAKAQVEQGKMLLAEDSLKKKEEKLKLQRAQQAEMRNKKEQQYADLTLKMMQAQQRAQQSAAFEQQQRQQHQIEEAIKSQDKANKYLKKTLSKIRQREFEEETRQKEHIERRMETLLKLKKDIANNRENLRALHARNKAIAKQKAAVEEMKRQTIEMEGGNPDEELIKRRRLEEFEKEKELFRYKQRQQQVKIAEKILLEEERMKQKKQQQPSLFVDPNKEKEKIVKPHRRRKIKLLTDGIKSQEQEECHEIDMSKYEDVEDSDDEDESFSPTTRTKEHLMLSDPANEDSVDTLAKPEFEGMWDKHKPYKAPKDTDGEIRLPGASKMEKDIMKKVLEKHRKGIIVKQVAGGKEFQGQPFYSKPSIIHFKDFEIGKTYKKKVILTNVSYSVNYCKLVGITEHLKDFINLHFDPPGQMSAGLTCELLVTFKPMINEDLEGTVQFLAQTRPFEIPLLCTTKKCDLTVDKSTINFGTSVVGETLRRTFTLSNNGALGTKFEFFKVTGMKMQTATTAESSLGRMTTADTYMGGISPLSEVKAKDVTSKIKPDEKETEKPIDGTTGEEAETKSGDVEKQPDTNVAEQDASDNQSLVNEMQELYSLDGMKVGSVTEGEIGPFSTVKLEIIWQPTIPGTVDTEFSIVFDDPDSEKISVTALANAIDVPVWVERQSVDLKICMFDRLYQDTIVVNNRATTALRLKFEVCKELRNHLELLPKTGYVQAQSQFSAQLKFLPRKSLFEEAGKYFDKDTGVLEAPMVITVADQTRPVPFTVHAIVTNSDMGFDMTDIDFGYCTIYEAVTKTVKLTNYSLLPQQFGFLGIPEYVDIQPNDGFGTLLPMETVELDVIFKPAKAKEYSFELNCKSLINREFKIYCKGVGVHPPLELSAQVIHFRATAVDDVSTASIHVINSHTSANEFTHPVPRIGKGEIAPVGPTSFEFVVPEGAPISISPSVGTVEPGKKCYVQIRFAPHLDESDVRKEAVRMITRQMELQALEEYKASIDKEKELQEPQPKGGKKAPAPTKGKASPKAKGKGNEPSLTVSTKGPMPIEVPDENKIQKNSNEYAAAHTSLVRGFKGHFQSFVIPCYVASGKCDNPGELPYSIYNTLYLELHCPTIRPDLVVLSNSGRTTTEFGAVSIGQSVIKSITIHNISSRTIDIRSSCLDPEGPFSMLNALRMLPPDGSHTILICFTPHKEEMFQEVQEVICPHSTLHLTLKGHGVSPVVSLSVKDSVFDIGSVLSGEYREETFKIVNTSSLAVQYSIKLDSQSLLRHAKGQGLPNFISRDSQAKLLVGTQNNSGQQVFDCVPAEGIIPGGGTREITLTFAPDHPSDHYSDGVRIELFGQEEQHVFRVTGQCKPHIMYITGGEPLTPEVESLAALPAEETQEDEKPPPIPVLVTLYSVAKETEFVTATKEIYVGCVRTMAVSQKKNGEWIFDSLTQINALGFNVDPCKGMIDAGTKRPITITWKPPADLDSNKAMEASILCTVKGDVTEQYRIMLRGIVVSE